MDHQHKGNLSRTFTGAQAEEKRTVSEAPEKELTETGFLAEMCARYTLACGRAPTLIHS